MKQLDLYASICRRLSCRKYDMNPLPQDVLSEVEAAIGTFAPLYPDIVLTHRLVRKTKGRYHVEAPHYLIISGQGTPQDQESAGFLYEQFVLMLDAMDLGSVWLGSSFDIEAPDPKRDILSIGFGHAAEEVHRLPDAFKRFPIETISNAPDDICVKAVHLAPSGMNTQPWYLEKLDDHVLVYKRRLKGPVSLVYHHSGVDMGIALCHYMLACRKYGKPFYFTPDTTLPPRAGYLPFGVITE